MNVAVIGFGAQGQSALEYWAASGHSVTICDQNEALALPDGTPAQLGSGYLAGLDHFDLIVRSPSVHPSVIKGANPSAEIQNKVTTNTNEFFKVCPTKNIIGVTGTKGKGTTSTLISKMLEASGKRVHLGGNIGTPPLEMLKNNIAPDDWVVLELANFQLIDLKHSPHIAVCLMITPEHQDWHKDVAEYIESKQQLFRWQTQHDVAIYYGLDPNSEHIASTGHGQRISYMKNPGADVIEQHVTIEGQIICPVTDIKLLGQHNWQNVCAAVTVVWQITQDIPAIKTAISSFSGMEYRLELIRELNGIRYYNDSFGTTPETAIVALQAFTEPKILIVGGSEKGADYTELVTTIIENNVKHVVCIGITGKKIADLLEARKDERCVAYDVWDSYDNVSMQDVVGVAKKVAEPGDIVLLSTASASFDMFKNYKDRGDQFNEVVKALA